MKNRKLSVLGMVLIALMVFVTGCATMTGSSSASNGEIASVEGESLSATGTILLKVNPEIAIEYNEEGRVTSLIGENDDGKKIVDNYSDYIGKESGLVLEELITKMHEAGYFVEEIEGESRRIVLELESGSTLPQDDFLEELSLNIQKAVSNLDTEADVVRAKDSGQNKGEETKKPEMKVEKAAVEQPKAEADYIGMSRAKEIALNHAGVDVSQARWDDAEFDYDDGVPSYELEFDVGRSEYEYDIHAVSGEILKVEQDIEKAKKPQTSRAEAPAPAKRQTPTKKQAPAEKKPEAKKELTKDEAIQIALNHAGLTRADIIFDDIELDHDDGRKEWEIEFKSGNWEFEYEIDAANGNILDFEKDFDD